MRLFLDHNMSPETKVVLRGLGHTVTDTREQGMSKATDGKKTFAQRKDGMNERYPRGIEHQAG